MKIKYEDLVLTGEDAPDCYSVEDNKYMGYIVAKGTLEELAKGDWHNLFDGTFGIEAGDEELWPPEFNYVIIMEDMDDVQDYYRVYNYDCDPCGVYAVKHMEERLEDGDITLNDINDMLTDFNALPLKLHDGPDSFIWLWVMSDEDYQKLFDNPIEPRDVNHYESKHCGCEHDCCGCVSSRTLEVVNNHNGWISIFFNVQLNY